MPLVFEHILGGRVVRNTVCGLELLFLPLIVIPHLLDYALQMLRVYVDLNKRHAWIHPDQAKANKAIPVPLNENALAILKRRKGLHSEYVFTYQDKPIG
jgi:hypothetical protein